MFAFTKAPKPMWGWLYGIVTVMCGVLAVVETVIPDGPARRVLECVVTLALFGAMAAWVRANRGAAAGDRAGGWRAPRRSWEPAVASSCSEAAGEMTGALTYNLACHGGSPA